MAPIKKVGIPAHLKCCVAAPKTTENLSARDEVGAGGFSRELWVNEPERSAASKYPLNRTSTTKYSLLTFFPKGLYEQFRRLANLYFLFSAAISLTPLTPYSPVTVILPLIFVIGVSLIKEAVRRLLAVLLCCPPGMPVIVAVLLVHPEDCPSSVSFNAFVQGKALGAALELLESWLCTDCRCDL